MTRDNYTLRPEDKFTFCLGFMIQPGMPTQPPAFQEMLLIFQDML